MKNLLMILAISFVLFSCGGKKEDNVHTHDDGSTHGDHVAADTTKQEEFKVEADTVKQDTAHSHDGEKPHKH
jgi:hypothetical protein